MPELLIDSVGMEYIPECPLCQDGEMEGKMINASTPIWVCSTCPGILFEFSDPKNIEDLTSYINRGDELHD